MTVMLIDQSQDAWTLFLDCIEERCSAIEFANWIAPIHKIASYPDRIVLEIPNIFVQEYLLDNYKQDLALFLPLKDSGEPSIEFVIAEVSKKKQETLKELVKEIPAEPPIKDSFQLNPLYSFENFIEGPSNQFVKSAAMGVAMRPGKSYNPLFIHGGVGLGKTHLLHAIGHYIKKNHPKLKIHCITTEGFINDLVDNLRNKTLDKMKSFVNDDKKAKFDEMIVTINGLQSEYEKGAIMRPVQRMKSQFNKIMSRVRNELSPKLMVDQYVQ